MFVIVCLVTMEITANVRLFYNFILCNVHVIFGTLVRTIDFGNTSLTCLKKNKSMQVNRLIAGCLTFSGEIFMYIKSENNVIKYTLMMEECDNGHVIATEGQNNKRIYSFSKCLHMERARSVKLYKHRIHHYQESGF